MSTERTADGAGTLPGDDPGVLLGPDGGRGASHPSQVNLANNEPAYWALLDDQAGLDQGPGVIDRRDAQSAQALLRRAAKIDKDAVMDCANLTRTAAREVLLGILARNAAASN